MCSHTYTHAGKANAVSSDEVKKLQLALNEKEKLLARANHEVKAATDDAAIKEKELTREIERLTEENRKLISEGTVQLAVWVYFTSICVNVCIMTSKFNLFLRYFGVSLLSCNSTRTLCRDAFSTFLVFNHFSCVQPSACVQV